MGSWFSSSCVARSVVIDVLVGRESVRRHPTCWLLATAARQSRNPSRKSQTHSLSHENHRAKTITMLDFTSPGKPAIGSVISVRSPASCLSFHSTGKRMFVASEGDSKLHVIDCLKGKADRPAYQFQRETIRLVHAT